MGAEWDTERVRSPASDHVKGDRHHDHDYGTNEKNSEQGNRLRLHTWFSMIPLQAASASNVPFRIIVTHWSLRLEVCITRANRLGDQYTDEHQLCLDWILLFIPYPFFSASVPLTIPTHFLIIGSGKEKQLRIWWTYALAR